MPDEEKITKIESIYGLVDLNPIFKEADALTRKQFLEQGIDPDTLVEHSKIAEIGPRVLPPE